jgi:hypothetical protein
MTTAERESLVRPAPRATDAQAREEIDKRGGAARVHPLRAITPRTSESLRNVRSLTDLLHV